MKYFVVSIFLIVLVVSCKKERHNNSHLKEGIISHIVDADCGYLLWLDSSMYKISNEAMVYSICKDRMYTSVVVDYEILSSFSPITCPMYTTRSEAQQVKLVSVYEK